MASTEHSCFIILGIQILASQAFAAQCIRKLRAGNMDCSKYSHLVGYWPQTEPDAKHDRRHMQFGPWNNKTDRVWDRQADLELIAGSKSARSIRKL